MALHAGEIAPGRKCAGVQLVQRYFLPRPPAPVLIVPIVARGIDHLAPSVHVLRLISRGGIGHVLPVDDVAVATAGSGRRGGQAEPSAVLASERQPVRTAELEVDGRRLGCPEAKAHAGADDFGAEGQLMVALHPRLPRRPASRLATRATSTAAA